MANSKRTMNRKLQLGEDKKPPRASARATARLATEVNESLYASGGYLDSQTSDTQVFGFSPNRSDGSPARKRSRMYLSQPSTPRSDHDSNITEDDNAHLEFMIVDIHEQLDMLSSRIEELDARALEARKKRKELEEKVGKLMGLRLMRLKTALQPESTIDLTDDSPSIDRFSSSSAAALTGEENGADVDSPGASQEIDGTFRTQLLSQLARDLFGRQSENPADFTSSPGASQEIDGTISTQYVGQLVEEFFDRRGRNA